MHVAKHSRPNHELVGRLWSLYATAYRKVAEQAISREMLSRAEFEVAVGSETNRLWVVWDGTRAVAMSLIATDAVATRFVSREYFERYFPERFARGEVHYVMWAVVDPEYVASVAVTQLARGGLALEAAEGALLVFDVPEVNQPGANGGASALLIRLARMVGDATLVPLGLQRFYAVDFDRARDADEAEVASDELLAYMPSAAP